MPEPLPPGIPLYPMKQAAVICGCSVSKGYKLLQEGEWKAVSLGGKTLVTRESLVAYLAKAKPWEADRERVDKAIQGRRDVRERQAAARGTAVKSRAARKAPRAAPRGHPAITTRDAAKPERRAR